MHVEVAQHLGQLGFLSATSEAHEDLVWSIGRFIERVSPNEALVSCCAILNRIHEAGGLFANSFFGALILNCS